MGNRIIKQKNIFKNLTVILICRYLFIGMEQNPNGGEDLMTLEAEISELQRENARVESQMIKLKSDINAMESHLTHGEKVSTYKKFKYCMLFFIITMPKSL